MPKVEKHEKFTRDYMFSAGVCVPLSHQTLFWKHFQSRFGFTQNVSVPGSILGEMRSSIRYNAEYILRYSQIKDRQHILQPTSFWSRTSPGIYWNSLPGVAHAAVAICSGELDVYLHVEPIRASIDDVCTQMESIQPDRQVWVVRNRPDGTWTVGCWSKLLQERRQDLSNLRALPGRRRRITDLPGCIISEILRYFPPTPENYTPVLLREVCKVFKREAVGVSISLKLLYCLPRIGFDANRYEIRSRCRHLLRDNEGPTFLLDGPWHTVSEFVAKLMIHASESDLVKWLDAQIRRFSHGECRKAIDRVFAQAVCTPSRIVTDSAFIGLLTGLICPAASIRGYLTDRVIAMKRELNIMETDLRKVGALIGLTDTEERDLFDGAAGSVSRFLETSIYSSFSRGLARYSVRKANVLGWQKERCMVFEEDVSSVLDMMSHEKWPNGIQLSKFVERGSWKKKHSVDENKKKQNP